MKQLRQSRRGFTLIELLVVIAIIAVLVALLLPAVQQAREAARRSQCKNNLKQIGLAISNYEETYQTLPVGAYSCCWGTWLVALLPYVDQQGLAERYVYDCKYDQLPLGGSARYSGALNTPVTSTRIQTYSCPSDQENKPIIGITSHNYAANFGNTHYGQANYNGLTFGGAPFFGGGPPARAAKYRDITDGLSNTIAIAEVLQGKGSDLRGFSWWGDASEFTTYLMPNDPTPDRIYTAGYCVNQPQQNLPCAVSTAADPTMFASRSRHIGGVQLVMCDGSTKFVSENVSLSIWRGISTTQGNEVGVDLP